MIAQEYDLDMTPGEEPLEIHLNRNDTDFSLLFRLFSGIGILSLESGTTAEIRGRDAAGAEYSENASVDIEAKTVSVSGSAELTACAGAGTYEICLTHGGKELYSANFHIIIEPPTR